MAGGGAGLVRVETGAADFGPDRDPSGLIRLPGHFGRPHPAQCGQERLLIVVRLEGGQVEEDCRPVPPGPAVQRCGDQVPTPPAGSTSWDGNSRS